MTKAMDVLKTSEENSPDRIHDKNLNMMWDIERLLNNREQGEFRAFLVASLSMTVDEGTWKNACQNARRYIDDRKKAKTGI